MTVLLDNVFFALADGAFAAKPKIDRLAVTGFNCLQLEIGFMIANVDVLKVIVRNILPTGSRANQDSIWTGPDCGTGP